MKKYYKINEKIRAKEVRLIHGDENLGVVSKEDALKKARELDKDLVLFAEKANPPVAKIVDFNKFLYEQNKKQSAAKSKSKKSELKELRFGPNIGDGDLRIKAQRAREFIEDGDQVKVTIQLRGRERAFPKIAREKVEIFYEQIKDIARKDKEIKEEGSRITATFVKE